MDYPFAESFKIKMVEQIYRSTREERENWIRQARYNLFRLRSQQVYIDLLTDSGTGAMSDRQWSAIMLGDESYAGASSYYILKDTIEKIFDFPYFLPTHQGRAAENVLFSVLLSEDQVVPGNSHFDTTKAHIEFRKAIAIDCTIDEAFDTESLHQFKGNIDINKLQDTIKKYSPNRIPCIIVTLTNNTAGGQPVSMENLRQVYQIAKQYGIYVVFDSARFAENAYFIKTREAGYNNKSIKEIVREMYQYADIMTMSSKKDGLVNIGGFIAMRSEELYHKASIYNIMFEGYVTYGGMAGRDMNALAVGLDECIEFDYLETRIGQVKYLGEKLIQWGIPVQKPIGGHAVFVDAKKFFPLVPIEQYVAQLLAVELYIEAGVRGVEVGSLLADRDPITRRERYPLNEFLRLAIPRRVYTNNHMNVVANALRNLYEKRVNYKTGFRIVKEQPIMRHFTVELERI